MSETAASTAGASIAPDTINKYFDDVIAPKLTPDANIPVLDRTQMPDAETYGMQELTERYSVLRLQTQSADGWAVIQRPAGAIVVGVDGKLLMRLTRDAAEAAARAMNGTALASPATIWPELSPIRDLQRFA